MSDSMAQQPLRQCGSPERPAIGWREPIVWSALVVVVLTELAVGAVLLTGFVRELDVQHTDPTVTIAEQCRKTDASALSGCVANDLPGST